VLRGAKLAAGCACVVLQIAVWWRAAVWYPRLPDRYPIHFDASGTPDGWASKSVGTWFLLPLVSLVMTGLMMGLALGGINAMARHTPGLINIPRKDEFLRLSPEERVRVLGPMSVFLLMVGAMEGGLFLWLVEGIGRVATGAAQTLSPWAVFVFVGVVLTGAAVSAVVTVKGIGRRP
jgi:uncharacterized membrane protein